ncbi:hypothetical protein ACWDSL_28995 [Streptomyces sp. NPDC000941]
MCLPPAPVAWRSKSSVAAGLRDGFGRGLALVGQDHLRRAVLREHDRPGAANIGLIDTVARYALDADYHVVVEGILYADHRGSTYGFYLDVPLEETLARHATKHRAEEYGEAEMRSWYREQRPYDSQCASFSPATQPTMPRSNRSLSQPTGSPPKTMA